jgi:hypothetical protein
VTVAKDRLMAGFVDGDGGVGESGLIAVVTEFSDGKEGMLLYGGGNMGLGGINGGIGKLEVGGMSGCHGVTIGEGD